MNKVETFIFCPPPPGKPNPLQPYDPKKPRERVVQAGQKGETCFYYALNMLRQRIGKKATPETQHLREMEVKISAIRKKLTTADKQYKYHFDFVKNLLIRFQVRSLSRRDVKTIVTQKILLLNDQVRDNYFNLLKTFTDQNEEDDLLTYIDSQLLKEKMLIKRDFTETLLGESIKNFYSGMNVLDKEWDSLSVLETAWMCDVLFNFCLCERYSLAPAGWHPNQMIESLFQDVKEHGPLLVFGYHGRGYYDCPPFQLADAIAGRPIFGWKPNTSRTNEDEKHHAVVVVGVNLDKKCVYFLDPRDSSGPNEKDQKVYVVSYERFKSASGNILGIQKTDKEGKVVHQPKMSYAYYSPFKGQSI